jgi:hypothetical protein
MSKVTAVEFLIDEIRKVIIENGRLDAISISELKMKAKAMEKQQIVEAYKADMIPMSDEDGEQYYNETYGK